MTLKKEKSQREESQRKEKIVKITVSVNKSHQKIQKDFKVTCVTFFFAVDR